MKLLMAFAVVASSLASTAPAQSSADAAVMSLVQRFVAARHDFDPAALAATLAPDYEEVSPVGDVDGRAEVLGFYTPEKRSAAPVMTASDVTVRARGETALLTQKLSFTPPGAVAARSARVRYVARRTVRGWQLVSTQYTPIPPAR